MKKPWMKKDEDIAAQELVAKQEESNYNEILNGVKINADGLINILQLELDDVVTRNHKLDSLAYEALKLDIKNDGAIFLPIVIANGKIIDGRHRQMIAEELARDGIDVAYVKFEDLGDVSQDQKFSKVDTTELGRNSTRAQLSIKSALRYLEAKEAYDVLSRKDKKEVDLPTHKNFAAKYGVSVKLLQTAIECLELDEYRTLILYENGIIKLEREGKRIDTLTAFLSEMRQLNLIMNNVELDDTNTLTSNDIYQTLESSKYNAMYAMNEYDKYDNAEDFLEVYMKNHYRIMKDEIRRLKDKKKILNK